MMRLRNYFLTGFIVCAPLAITAWITWSFMGWVDSWVKPYIPARYWPDSHLPFAIPGFGLIVALILITLIGFLTANIIGRTIIGWGERLLSRTPLVRTVYMALKQIFETVLADRSTSFKTAALMEYPRTGVWCVVLVATDAKGEVARKLADESDEMIAVFLPPAPNPTSGFLLFVPRKDLRILDMSIENALKLVVSSGLVMPDDAERGKVTLDEAEKIVAARQSRQRETEAAE